MRDIVLRQACAPAGAPAGLEVQGPSSAALSESPAALAMPAKGAQAHAEADKKAGPVADISMGPTLSDIPAALARPASGEQPP